MHVLEKNDVAFVKKLANVSPALGAVEVDASLKLVLQLTGPRSSEWRQLERRVLVKVELTENRSIQFFIPVKYGYRSYEVYPTTLKFSSSLQIGDGKTNALHTTVSNIESQSSMWFTNTGTLSIRLSLPVQNARSIQKGEANRISLLLAKGKQFPLTVEPSNRIEIRGFLTIYSLTKEMGDIFLNTNCKKCPPVFSKAPCASCGSLNASILCDMCHLVHYCRSECRSAHWAEHIPACSNLTTIGKYEYSVCKPLLNISPAYLCFNKAVNEPQTIFLSNVGDAPLSIDVLCVEPFPPLANVNLKYKSGSKRQLSDFPSINSLKTELPKFTRPESGLVLQVEADLSACDELFESMFHIKVVCHNDIVLQPDGSKNLKVFNVPVLLSRKFDGRHLSSDQSTGNLFNNFFCVSTQSLVNWLSLQYPLSSEALMIKTVDPILEILRCTFSVSNNKKKIDIPHPLHGQTPASWPAAILAFFKKYSRSTASEQARSEKIDEALQSTPENQYGAYAVWFEKFSNIFATELFGAPVALALLLSQEDTKKSLRLCKILFSRCFRSCYDSSIFNDCIDCISDFLERPAQFPEFIGLVKNLSAYLPELRSTYQCKIFSLMLEIVRSRVKLDFAFLLYFRYNFYLNIR